MKAVVIGGSSYDTLLHVPEIKTLTDDMSLFASKVIHTIGGTGAGKALCLDVLGVDVTLVTNLGNDVYKEKILDFYNKTTINVVPVLCDKTVTHTNIMHGKGNRISVFTSFPKEDAVFNENVENYVKDADIVFLNINNYCRQYIPMIKKHKKLCLVDIHDYDPPNPYHQEFIDAADILVGSSVNIPDKEKFLQQMVKGRKSVTLTSGSKGIEALHSDGTRYSLEGYSDFEYIDSNGAGDSFCAGLVYECLRTGDMGKGLKFGTICGAMACSSETLFPLDITIEELYRRVKELDK